MQIVKQDGYKDCGVSCLLSIIRFYGGDNSLEYLREITFTTRKGVSAYNLIEAAKILGFDSYGLEGELDQLTDDMLPIISHVIINKRYQHFVVIYKIDRKSNKIYIMDPSSGKKILSSAQFNLLSSKTYIYLKPIKKIILVKRNKIVDKLFKSFLVKNKYLFIYIVIFSFITLLFNIILSQSMKILINNGVNVLIVSNIYQISFCILVLSIYKEIISFVKNILLLKWQTIFSDNIIGYVFKNLMLLPYSYYKNRNTGEVLSRMQDINIIKDFLTKFLACIIIEPFCIITFLFCLFYLNKILFVVVILYTIVTLVLELVNQRIIKMPLYRYYLREDQLNGIFVESISVNSINTIKNNHVEDVFVSRFNNINKKYLENSYIVSYIILLKEAISNNIKEITNVFLISVGSILIIKSDFSLASLVIFQSIFSYYNGSLFRILDIIKEYENFRISKSRVEDMFSVYKENFVCSNYFKSYNLMGSIQFNKLSYSENGKKIFNKLSIVINPFDRVFLTGLSGSGKTTLMRILLRYINVNSGNVFINDMDVCYYHLDVLRRLITYVSQSEVLFTDTLYKNITLGCDVMDDKFQKICRITEIDKIINRTCLGKMEMVEENGSNYSGGERQRIIISRALLRESDIYIFDEAFSQIDIDTANRIIERIFKYLKNKTIIIISHRKPNVKLYNRILKLDNGIIVE